MLKSNTAISSVVTRPVAPEGREEREGERNAGEVRGDAREGDDGRTNPFRQAAEDDGGGELAPINAPPRAEAALT